MRLLMMPSTGKRTIKRSEVGVCRRVDSRRNRRHLFLEKLEDRRMLALVGLSINLYEDQAGQPGALIPDNTVHVGQTFFVEIAAQDLRAEPKGLDSLWLDLRWDAEALEVIDDPFDPADPASHLITQAFPYNRRGTVDESNADAMISDLRGASRSQAVIGDEAPERFSAIHFRADAVTDKAEIVIPASHVIVGLMDHSSGIWPLHLDVQTARITVLPATAIPTVSIGDAMVVEGEDGNVQAAFPVTLSHSVDVRVEVQANSSDGTATGGEDYVPIANRTVMFDPGQPLTQWIPVFVRGDATVETDETFQLQLSNPVNATINDATAVGTIVNDDDGQLNPPVAYSLRLTDTAAQALSTDEEGRYLVSPGQEFVAEVYVTDVRPKGDARGIVSAYADLRTDGDWFTWDADSLLIAAAFAEETYGEVFNSSRVVNEAGGKSAEPATIGNESQVLFQLRANVHAEARDGSVATLSLDPAELAGHDTRVWDVDAKVAAIFEQVQVVVEKTAIEESATSWQNPADPLDVNGDGSVSPLDVLTVVNVISLYGAFPVDDPPGEVADFIDVNGDGLISALDALFVSNYLNFGTASGSESESIPPMAENSDRIVFGGRSQVDTVEGLSEERQLSPFSNPYLPAGDFDPALYVPNRPPATCTALLPDGVAASDGELEQVHAIEQDQLPAPADVDRLFALIGD